MKKKFLKLRSRHPSAKDLRLTIEVGKKAVYRHGSTTELNVPQEINSVEAVKTSSSKFLMKEAFAKAEVRTAQWYFRNGNTICEVLPDLTRRDIPREDIPFPLVAKLNMGSRGRGMVKIDTIQHFDLFLANRADNRYYFEKFYSYSREYRLHVDASGCFYTCRKVLKKEIENDKRWFRNDSNCNWILEENPLFDKPVNWPEIEAECVKALKAVGLDIGACDVKVQSRLTTKDEVRKNPEFIIIEINSAPSFGDITLQKYKERLPLTLKNKYATV